ncbi:hypothetical protein DJ68_17110 [Halorubrum sp. C3]|nr:hypothetical protein DJ68_17110 [Halorubrum sp. C3]
MELTDDIGISSLIVPNKFMKASYGETLRNKISGEKKLLSIVDFGDYQIFDGVSTYTCILSVSSQRTDNATFATADSDRLKEIEKNTVEQESLENTTWNTIVGPEGELLTHLLSEFPNLGDLSQEIYQGVITGGDDHFILNKIDEGSDLVTVERRDNGEQHQIEKQILRPFSKGADVRRYSFQNDDKVLFYPYSGDKQDSSLIPENGLKENYPKAYEYLSEYRESLKSRGSSSMNYPSWYSLWNPRSGWKFEEKKIVTPVIAESGRFAYDDSEMYFNGSGGGGGGAYGIILSETDYSERAIAGILNSNVSDFVIRHTSSQFQGGFYAYNRQYIKEIPIPERKNSLEQSVPRESIGGNDSPSEVLDQLVQGSERSRRKRYSLNLNLLDYLGVYNSSQTLGDIGLIQPPENAADSVLQSTAEQRPNLRVGKGEVIRQSSSTVEIYLTARYKPDDEDAHETDQWGYTETEYLPAFRITDLTEREADLIEHFVPVAVDEAGGFANFRETATKTNSLIDRLKTIEVPDVDDVADDLENYLATKERAEELDAKIEQTDALIDEIVYELYGLTDEEIEIVEEAVSD